MRQVVDFHAGQDESVRTTVDLSSCTAQQKRMQPGAGVVADDTAGAELSDPLL